MTPDQKRVALLRLKFEMIYRGLSRDAAAAKFAEIMGA
jgi:hypothetical protein